MPRLLGESKITSGSLLLFLAFITISAALAGCSQEAEKAAQPAKARKAQVRVVTLAPQPWTQSISSYGVVEPAREVMVTVDYSGTVRKVNFKEGQTIKAGEPLLVFDSAKRRLRLDRARNVAQEAKAQLDKLRDQFQRRRKLYESGAVSLEEFRRSQADFKSAAAQYQEALASEGLAQREVSDTTLLSPVNGVVAKKDVEPGKTVMPGTVLAVVQTTGALRVTTFVTEKDVNSLRVGGTARVTAPGVPGKVYEARVESVGAKAHAQTGNFAVKLAVENPQGLLRDGMSARVELTGLVINDALLVPASALADRRLRRVVYKVVEGKAVEVEPVLAATLDENLPVLDGLKAGDVIIVSGLDSVIDGSAVEAEAK